MSRRRRNHSPDFKAKVALAALKGDRTISDLAAQYELHPNQIVTWKKQMREQASTLFSGKSPGNGDTEEKIQQLHAKIGQLTMERDFLSKALGR